MIKEPKLRAWDKKHNEWYGESEPMILTFKGFHVFGECTLLCTPSVNELQHLIITYFTGLLDKNDNEIYFGDILRFSDKWEWYKGEYGIKMMAADGERLKELKAQYEAEPYEERVVEDIKDYEWLLSSEIQQYWEVIGNIHENPDLLANP